MGDNKDVLAVWPGANVLSREGARIALAIPGCEHPVIWYVGGVLCYPDERDLDALSKYLRTEIREFPEPRHG